MTPSIRFSGFTENYKSYALHTFMSRIMRKNTKLETDIPLTISSQDGLVDQRTYFGKTIASSDMSGYYLLKNGEFTYNKSTSKGFPFGSIKRLNKYPLGAVSTLYICFALKAEAFDSDYIEHYFDSQKWNKEVSMICAEGARNHGLLNVPIDDFFDTLHHLPPSIHEQQKIAAFLSAYDEKVALQKGCVEALEERKKGLLQKIFSQEIRFKANDGSEYPEWEECQLKKVLYEYKEKCEKDGSYEHVSLTKEGVVPKTERYDRDFLVTNENKEYRVTHYDDICYNPANLKFGVICRNKYGDAIFSPIYVTFKVNKDFLPKFVEMLVTRKDFINYSLKYQEGTVYERMDVSPEDLLSITVKIPKIEEQKKIADFFTAIDAQISFAKEKLETLQEIKKGLLQQMFC